ncbi:baseplate J/gp47 family protein [Halomonas sp. BM-2019]|uniref:baseplate J/gp47 family protein n=1 Tax=Halomonas sp. BM-2019 TaxID=2811227 RepID=UPI001B3C1D58|nr:MAG: baseplate J/gp47 family protein [Halomonas sp. BM-2019]
MPLPIPNLDDRRFDDLVEEARARLATQLPELTRLSPGDPAHAFIDLFAWLTETILYRANLIPERQRRVFLNLLQIPLRPARPARGVVCIDAGPTHLALTPLVREGAQLSGGDAQRLTVIGELQPTSLTLELVIKYALDDHALEEMGITLHDLREQFGLRSDENPQPFRPRTLQPGAERLSLADSLDKAYYLALLASPQLQANLTGVRTRLAGITLNIALAPFDERTGDEDVITRQEREKSWGLVWELISRDRDGHANYLPLEVLSDSSFGGRETGIVRLRLPRNPALFEGFVAADPMFGGVGDGPPETADPQDGQRVALWLRLRCPEEPDLELGHLAINAVEVIAQGLREDLIVGIGSGQPNQSLALPDRDIDTDSLYLEVEENGVWVRWQQVDLLAGQSPDARVYRLDAEAGHVFFGDGIVAGRRPAEGRRIRIQSYRFGGGAQGNLPPGGIAEIVDGSPRHRVRHEWPLRGGMAAETVEQAEQRIPAFLTHRNRAVSLEDFVRIVEANPVAPVARAEVFPGFIPGASLNAVREDMPGAISVFVLPPGPPLLGETPKPTARLLKDVFDYLLPRSLLGTELYVLSPEFVPLALGVVVEVRDIDTEQQTLRAVRQALVDYLWVLAPGGAAGAGWPLGAAVRANELATRAARVDGVLAVNALALFTRAESGWRRLPANEPLTLLNYQLPEVLGVHVESGGPDDTPHLPGGIGRMEGDGPDRDGGTAVPVPVIPDVC